MNLTRERGSTAAIIIVILVLALLGAVGYVFWGKLSNVSMFGSGAKNESKTSSDALQTASFDKSFGINMYFKYPGSWKIEKTQSGTFPVTAKGTSIETYTLTAPDKKYSVVYRLGAGGGIGGTCSKQDAATIVAADSKDVDGWKGVKFVEAVTKTHDGKYLAKASLVSLLTMMNVKKGESACSFGLGTTDVPAMFLDLTLLDASVHGVSDTNIIYGTTDRGATSEKEAKRQFSGASYDQAKAILLSTTLK